MWDFRWFPDARSAPLPREAWVSTGRLSVPASHVMPVHDASVGGPHGAPVYTNVRYPFPVDPPYPPDVNPVADYRTRVRWQGPLPARAVLRFEGVEGAADVWWSGSYVGSTRGSRLPVEFTLDGLVTGDDELLVRLHHFSAASYLEDQDAWWLPGIIREVVVEERPEHGVDAIRASAEWSDGAGLLRVDVDLPRGVDPHAVDVELVGVAANLPLGAEVRVEVEPWSAESPRLYTLRVSTGRGPTHETVELAIGFRSVAIRDGVFTVNGVPITLRGVNRHEHHPVWGRHVPADTVRDELELMKASGINAIRTAHYPPHPRMLDLADELGFWVMDECDLETHGFEPVGWRANPTDDSAFDAALRDRMARLVERDRHHPSVIMWSLGNEAGVGRNLTAMADEARRRDPSRPVHYEGDQECRDVDVWSRMYASPEEVAAVAARREPALEDPVADARRRSMPFVLCEYAHAMGTGPGGLSEYQQLFDTSARLMGGFVWEWLEHGIEVERDGRLATAYGGDFGEPIHDGNFVIDGLVAADRTPRPQLADLAAVFAAIVLEVTDDAVTIRSRYDIIDTAHVGLQWRVETDGGVVGEGSVPAPTLPPRGAAQVPLPPEAVEARDRTGGVLTVTATVVTALAGLPVGHVLGVGQAVSSVRALTNWASTRAGRRGQPGAVQWDDATGATITVGDQTIGPFALDLWRAPTDNDLGVGWTEDTMPSAAERWSRHGLDRPLVRVLERTSRAGGLVVRTRVGAAATDAYVDCTWEWTPVEAGVRLDLVVSPGGGWPKDWSSHWARVAIVTELDASIDDPVQWSGLGPGPSYPDTGQACRWGWFRETVRSLHVPTVRPQEAGRRAGVRWANIADRFDIVSPHGVGLTVRPWSPATIAATTHEADLVPTGRIHVAIDLAAAGVGTAACGPGVLPPYRLPAQTVRGSITFLSRSDLEESS